KTLAAAGSISQRPSRVDDPVRRIPVQMLKYPINDGFLSFQPERIDGIDCIPASFLRAFERRGKGVVKIPLNLYHLSTELKCLTQLSGGDFAFRNIHITLYILICSVHCGRGRSVASRRTNNLAYTEHFCLGNCSRHTIILERAAWIVSFRLQ